MESDRNTELQDSTSAPHGPRRPTAIGLVRTEISGPETAHHAVEVCRHAELVHAGKLILPVLTPRERAAARCLPFAALDHEPPSCEPPDMSTLLDILDGLTAADLQPPRRQDAVVGVRRWWRCTGRGRRPATVRKVIC